MSIKLYLPSRFYYLWEGKEVLDVTGKTVAECLDDLVHLIPLMKKALSYESETLDPHIRVLVNQERIGQKVWQEKYTMAIRFISSSEPIDEAEVQMASLAIFN